MDAPMPPVESLGYEQARDELAAVVARLESGAGTLEDAMAAWERGEALAERCQQWLDGARRTLAEAQRTRAQGPIAQGTTGSGPGPASGRRDTPDDGTEGTDQEPTAGRDRRREED